MIIKDMAAFTTSAVVSHRLRSILTALGIAIGVTAVVLLTSIGEGLQQYILKEFTQFGTNIVAVAPGKAQTFGASSGVFNSQRPLSIEDALALRRVPYVTHVVPVVQGTAAVKGNGRRRDTLVQGTGPDMPTAFAFEVESGEFLPRDDPLAPRALAVLGSKLKTELYGEKNPIGDRLRVGGNRFRIVGVMKSKGTVLGFDLDEVVYIPAARALELFNRPGLVEIDLLYDESGSADEVAAALKRILIARHGSEDFSITTQQQMLDVLGSVLDVITFAVGALGSISLLVGGVGIFTIMTISVRERTSEIGLLRAVGALRSQIRDVFIGESIVLAGLGGVGGLIFGIGIVQFLRLAVPGLPVTLSPLYMLASQLVALFIGLIAGLLPARKAASMDPVEALRVN
jgi:putative ABC transport system permease protein